MTNTKEKCDKECKWVLMDKSPTWNDYAVYRVQTGFKYTILCEKCGLIKTDIVRK